MTDIQNLDNVKTLVNQFYAKVRENELLGPIFNGVIQDRWPEHLEKMYRFWQTVLLNEHTYSGTPFPPHAKLPVDKVHFDTWMKLFTDTVNENFKGNKAEEVKTRAGNMALMFHHKIQYLRNEES